MEKFCAFKVRWLWLLVAFLHKCSKERWNLFLNEADQLLYNFFQRNGIEQQKLEYIQKIFKIHET